MKKSKRITRNVIITLIIVLLGVCMVFTAQAQSKSAMPQAPGSSQQGGSPPSMPSGDNSGNSDSSDSSNNQGTPPEKPSGDSSDSGNNQGTPPEKPSGDSSDNSNNQGTPPEKPSGDSSDSDKQSTDSQSTDSSSSSNTENSASGSTDGSSDNQPSMPSGNAPDMSNAPSGSGSKTQILYYVLFGVEALGISAGAVYLILSGFNKLRFKKAFGNGKRITAFVLAVILITGIATGADVAVFSKNQQMPQQNIQASDAASSADANGATEVTGEQTLSASYESSTADENAVLVKDGGNATIDGATVTKSAGDSSNTENSEFYGVNSAVLVTENSTATIKNAKISTAAKGANAVFATGENAKIYISDTTVTSTGSGSARGLDATYGGYIEASNVTVKTSGASCAALATDRGEGTVKASGSTLSTSGKGSPIIYSTGDISIDGTTGTASGSQAVVIEGKNSATVKNSTLTTSAQGNRGDDGTVDKCGVFIYQSMSGDADEGTGTFTAENSTIEISSDSDVYKTAPMFFATNTAAKINLKNTKLKYGSGILLNAAATDEWGNSGSNGADVTLTAESQTLTGDIKADKISTVALTLKSSSYSGTINGDNTAEKITLTLDKNSTVKLTGDSYVTSLSDSDSTYSNIDLNGYTLYVNGTALKK